MCLSLVLQEIIPLPTPEALLNPPATFQAYEAAVTAMKATAPSDDDPKLLDLSVKLFDNDASRRASIDTRAGSMMSAITLAATLVTGVGFTTFKDSGGLSHEVFRSLFVTFVLALAYLTITIILLFQIQGRMFRATPDPSDLPTPPAATPSAYPRQLAVSMLEYTIYNYKVNNRVVNRLWIAQKCFRNALVVLVVGGVITTVLMAAGSPAPPSGLRLAQTLARQAGCRDLPSLVMDKNGQWSGVCLRATKPENVLVHPDGQTEFPP